MPEDPVSRMGDLWLRGPHPVLCGDATSIDAVSRLLRAAECVMNHSSKSIEIEALQPGVEELERVAANTESGGAEVRAAAIMRAILKRLCKVEEKLTPQRPNGTGGTEAAELIRESRRRRLEAEGLPFSRRQGTHVGRPLPRER